MDRYYPNFCPAKLGLVALGWAAFLVGPFFETEAVAKDFSPPRIRIHYNGAPIIAGDPRVSGRQARIDFQKACRNLGEPLMVHKGPWGIGIFSDYRCEISGKLRPDKKSESDWVLRVVPTGARVKMEIGQIRPGASRVNDRTFKVYNSISLPPHPEFFKALHDRELGDYLAYALLSSLPASFIVPNYGISNSPSVDLRRKAFIGRPWRQNAKFIQPQPAESVLLYRMKFAKKKRKYLRKNTGEMAFMGFEVPPKTMPMPADVADQPKEKKKKDQGDDDEEEEEDLESDYEGEGGGSKSKKIEKPTLGRVKPVVLSPMWRLDKDAANTLKRGNSLWGRNAKHSARTQKRLNRLVVRVYRYLTEKNESFVRGLMVQQLKDDGEDVITDKGYKGLDVELPGGYVGIRYGVSMVKKDPLLAKTSFLGLLVNVKAGVMEGFGFYYDTSPKVSNITESGEEVFVEWSRLAIGYAFDFQLSDWRFDLTPRIGSGSYATRLEFEDDLGDLVVQSFNLKKAVSVGLELGLELRVPLVSARAWLGQDGAISFANDLAGATVTSFRGGIDAFYTVGELFSVGPREFGFAILGFTFFDWVTIADPNVPEYVEDETEDARIRGFNYTTAFMGLGISMSW